MTAQALLKWLMGLMVLLLALLTGPAYVALTGQVDLTADWTNTDRTSAGLAPAASEHPEAVLQIYAARAFSWRGAFAVHTWIATKPSGADAYDVHEMTAWRGLQSRRGTPDQTWYGNPPTVILDLRGDAADAALARLPDSLARYPYADNYRAWPGPNSNTFTAWVVRDIPEMQVALPSTAVGKDYLGSRPWARTPSNTGGQVSVLGAVGLTLAAHEGLEINILGLSFGLDPLGLAIHVPGIGRIGLTQPD